MKEENSDFTFYLEYASSYALETSAFLSQDRQVGEGGTELCGGVSLVGNIPGLDFFLQSCVWCPEDLQPQEGAPRPSSGWAGPFFVLWENWKPPVYAQMHWF